MAILSKIQKSSGLLIGMIGLAMFAFIIMDLLKNSSSLFRPSPEYVAKINGEKIPTNEFRERMQALQQQYGPSVSSGRVMKQVWDQMVKEKLFEAQYKKAGITIPSVRVYERMKNDPTIRRMFTNEQGVFDENAFLDYLDEINASKDENNENYKLWRTYQQSLKEQEGQAIYDALVRSAMMPTLKEAAWEYHKQNDKVTFDFAVAPYSVIPDSTVKITEADVKNYIAKHADLYQVDESRDLTYVLFKNEPSDRDYREAEAELKELTNDREIYDEKTGKTVVEKGLRNIENDKLEDFVRTYSDDVRPIQWVLVSDLPADIKDSIAALAAGGIYGPVRYPGALVLYKAADVKENVPKTAKASHILISYAGALQSRSVLTEEEARKKADSLLQILKRHPEKFADLARQYSEDPGSAAKGGDLGEFKFGTMVEPFNDFVFSGKKGDLGIVKTRYGYHIIRIDDLSSEKDKAVKLAQVVRRVVPGEATLDSLYTLAAEYYAAAKKAGDLNKVDKEHFVKPLPVKRIKRYEFNLPGLGEQPSIVSWLYDKKTKKGDIRRFELNEGYAIVQYTGRTPKGLMPVSEALVLVKPILLKKKKFEMLKDSLQGNSLEEIVSHCKSCQKGKAENVSLASPLIPSIGKEPEVVAVAFIVPEGKISSPVEGNFGAFVVKPLQKTRAPELENYYSYLTDLKRKEQTSILERIAEALKKKAKIKDNRVILGY